MNFHSMILIRLIRQWSFSVGAHKFAVDKKCKIQHYFYYLGQYFSNNKNLTWAASDEFPLTPKSIDKSDEFEVP